MVAAAVKLTAAAWVGKPCATMVTRHSSDRIETISAFLPSRRRSCPLYIGSSSFLIAAKSHPRRDDPASYDPEDLRRASNPIEAYWLTHAAPDP
jgi:hypothetical protein